MLRRKQVGESSRCLSRCAKRSVSYAALDRLLSQRLCSNLSAGATAANMRSLEHNAIGRHRDVEQRCQQTLLKLTELAAVPSSSSSNSSTKKRSVVREVELLASLVQCTDTNGLGHHCVQFVVDNCLKTSLQLVQHDVGDDIDEESSAGDTDSLSILVHDRTFPRNGLGWLRWMETMIVGSRASAIEMKNIQDNVYQMIEKIHPASGGDTPHCTLLALYLVDMFVSNVAPAFLQVGNLDGPLASSSTASRRLEEALSSAIGSMDSPVLLQDTVLTWAAVLTRFSTLLKSEVSPSANDTLRQFAEKSISYSAHLVGSILHKFLDNSVPSCHAASAQDFEATVVLALFSCVLPSKAPSASPCLPSPKAEKAKKKSRLKKVPANDTSHTNHNSDALLWPGSYFHNLEVCDASSPNKRALPSTTYLNILNDHDSHMRKRLQKELSTSTLVGSNSCIRPALIRPLTQLVVSFSETAPAVLSFAEAQEASRSRAQHRQALDQKKTSFESSMTLMDKMLNQRGLLTSQGGDQDDSRGATLSDYDDDCFSYSDEIVSQAKTLKLCDELLGVLVTDSARAQFEINRFKRALQKSFVLPNFVVGKKISEAFDIEVLGKLLQEWSISPTKVHRCWLVIKQLSWATDAISLDLRNAVFRKCITAFVNSPYFSPSAVQQLPPVGLSLWFPKTNAGVDPDVALKWANTIFEAITVVTARCSVTAQTADVRSLVALCVEYAKVKGDLEQRNRQLFSKDTLAILRDMKDILSIWYLHRNFHLHEDCDTEVSRIQFDICKQLCGGSFSPSSVGEAAKNGALLIRATIATANHASRSGAVPYDQIIELFLALAPQIPSQRYRTQRNFFNAVRSTTLTRMSRNHACDTMPLQLTTLKLVVELGQHWSIGDLQVGGGLFTGILLDVVRAVRDRRKSPVVPISNIMFAQAMTGVAQGFHFVLSRPELISFLRYSSFPDLELVLSWYDDGLIPLLKAEAYSKIKDLRATLQEQSHTNMAELERYLEEFFPDGGTNADHLPASPSPQLLALFDKLEPVGVVIPLNQAYQMEQIAAKVMIPAAMKEGADFSLLQTCIKTQTLALTCILNNVYRGGYVTIPQEVFDTLRRGIKSWHIVAELLMKKAPPEQYVPCVEKLRAHAARMTFMLYTGNHLLRPMLNYFLPHNKSGIELLATDSLKCLMWVSRSGIPVKLAYPSIAAVCGRCESVNSMERCLLRLNFIFDKCPDIIGGGVKKLIEFLLPSLAATPGSRGAPPTPMDVALHQLGSKPQQIDDRVFQELLASPQCERLLSISRVSIVRFLLLLTNEKVAGPNGELFAKAVNIILHIRKDVCGEPPREKSLKDTFRSAVGSQEKKRKEAKSTLSQEDAPDATASTLEATLVAMTSPDFSPSSNSLTSSMANPTVNKKKIQEMYSLHNISANEVTTLLRGMYAIRPRSQVVHSQKAAGNAQHHKVGNDSAGEGLLLSAEAKKHVKAVLRDAALRRAMQLANTTEEPGPEAGIDSRSRPLSPKLLAKLVDALVPPNSLKTDGMSKTTIDAALPRDIGVVVRALLRRAVSLTEAVDVSSLSEGSTSSRDVVDDDHGDAAF